MIPLRKQRIEVLQREELTPLKKRKLGSLNLVKVK